MKKILYFLMVGAMALGMASCSKDDGAKDDGGIIDDGGSDVIEFDASKFPCLQGSNYYLFALSASAEAVIADKVVADYRVDDYNTFLYIWEETYNAGETSGPNMFGLIEGWSCLTVAGKGWSGCGFCCYNKEELDKLPGIIEDPENYYLHLAMKSQDDTVHTINFYSGNPDESFGVKIGGSYDSAEPTGEAEYGYQRDGEWHEIEIPMTFFTNKGLMFVPSKWAGATVGDPDNGVAGANGHNVLAILSGAYGTLNIDAAFVYKK